MSVTTWSTVWTAVARPRVRGGRPLRGRRGGRLGRASLVVGVGDAELGGVLVLPSRVHNQLQTVASVRRREVGGWLPYVAARVLDLLGDRVLRDGVGGRTLEQDEGDGARCGRVPGLQHISSLIQRGARIV
jgi:hypothetical protein